MDGDVRRVKIKHPPRDIKRSLIVRVVSFLPILEIGGFPQEF